jgi:hypothetical protein
MIMVIINIPCILLIMIINCINQLFEVWNGNEKPPLIWSH